MTFFESNAFLGFAILSINGIIGAEYALKNTTATLNFDLIAAHPLAAFLLRFNIFTASICIVALPVTAFINDGFNAAVLSFILWMSVTSLFSKTLANDRVYVSAQFISLFSGFFGWYLVLSSWFS